VCLLPIQTARRVPDFRDGMALWSAAIVVNPDMPRARLNLADAIWKSTKDAQRTADQLRIALPLLPASPLSEPRKQGYTFLAHVELGMLANAAGQPALAQAHYWAAAATDPRLARFIP
jgi:hypothetical protein